MGPGSLHFYQAMLTLLVMDYTPNGSLCVKARRPKLPCPAAACVPMSQSLPTLPSPAHPSRRQALRMVPSPPRLGPTTLGTGDHWFFPSMGCGHQVGRGPIIPKSIPTAAAARPPPRSTGSRALSPASVSCPFPLCPGHRPEELGLQGAELAFQFWRVPLTP